MEVRAAVVECVAITTAARLNHREGRAGAAYGKLGENKRVLRVGRLNGQHNLPLLGCSTPSQRDPFRSRHNLSGPVSTTLLPIQQLHDYTTQLHNYLQKLHRG